MRSAISHRSGAGGREAVGLQAQSSRFTAAGTRITGTHLGACAIWSTGFTMIYISSSSPEWKIFAKLKVSNRYKRSGLEVAAKLLLLFLLPLVLVEYRDFDYYLHPGLYCLTWSLICVSLIGILVIILRGVRRIRQHQSTTGVFWTVFSSFLLVISIVFRNELLFLKERWTFQQHRGDFRELTLLSEGLPPERSIMDTYIELPEADRSWSGETSIFVLRDPQNTPRLVALYSRPDTYYTYLPNQSWLPKSSLYFQYGHGINCFYKLGNHWFVCEIWC